MQPVDFFRSRIDAMINLNEQLGLERDALHAVLDTFCEDLLSSKQLARAGSCPVFGLLNNHGANGEDFFVVGLRREF